MSELWDAVDTAGEHAGRGSVTCAFLSNHQSCRQTKDACHTGSGKFHPLEVYRRCPVFLSHQVDIAFKTSLWRKCFLPGRTEDLTPLWSPGTGFGHPEVPPVLMDWEEMNSNCFFQHSDKNFPSPQPNLVQQNLHLSKALNWKLCSQYINEACDQIRDPFKHQFQTESVCSHFLSFLSQTDSS